MTKEEPKYIKLRTEGIFNLQNTAKEFNLTSAELVAFHNQYCGIHELLPLSLPKYVEYIYLPPKNFLERDIKLLKSANLQIPKIKSEKTYGVVLNFLPKELSIHYKIKVIRTGEIIEIIKEKTYVNNLEIDQTIEQLFEKAEQVLYPLKISTDINGGLSKILNSSEINDRWKREAESQLRKYYQSETGEEIINKLDQAFSDINKKRDMFDRNLFYKLFFLPIYQSYQNFKKDDYLSIYFAGISQEISYRIEYDLQKEFTRGDKIALNVTGKEEENIFNRNREKGEIDLLYKLHKETHEIFSITGSISAFEDGLECKIDFELYELKNSQ
ncbi:hypothetical protein IV494_00020 [Kaistella sp. G5-32]|uniref:LysM domain-containing protein n=1 Tax=Kaistella gelatinilytica TaxID=2787636 RepID=A0ABS0F765_9FLAO|nr:hypothetical protein [Kaistella gelatinilytica]MBF8455553.1 hypothetical protein [Kaistella gelatinilytica]